MFSGWLLKQSGTRVKYRVLGAVAKWDRRWVVLEDGILTYHKERDGPQAGVLDCRGATVQAHDANTFAVHGRERVLLLRVAGDAAVSAQWLAALRAASEVTRSSRVQELDEHAVAEQQVPPMVELEVCEDETFSSANGTASWRAAGFSERHAAKSEYTALEQVPLPAHNRRWQAGWRIDKSWCGACDAQGGCLPAFFLNAFE